MKKEKSSLLADSSGVIAGAKGSSLLWAGFFITMKTRNQKTVSKPPAGKPVHVTLRSKESGRILSHGNWPAELCDWIEHQAKEMKCSKSDAIARMLRPAFALLRPAA